MEQVIAAAILIFLLLFGVLSLSGAFISAQDVLKDAWQDMNAQSEDLQHTAISPVEMQFLDSGTELEVTIRNDGTIKLADFNRWDVFVEYFEDSMQTPVFHNTRLAYDADSAATNEWTDEAFYLDKANGIDEGYDFNILNPGEEVTLLMSVSPAIGVGLSAQVTVATQNGVTATLVGTRPPLNLPPTVVFNKELRVASGAGAAITADTLLTIDSDNDADELIYTVDPPPVQGLLTPGNSFTQQQIDDSGVFYVHNGMGDDTFSFTVTDGAVTLAPLSFVVKVDQVPLTAPPNIFIMPAQIGLASVISGAALQTIDADDAPENLIYTVTRAPSDGSLNLGTTFTQKQIDENQLTYTYTTAVDADMFEFVVSDGYEVIGPYTFNIIPVEATEAP